MSTFSTYDSTVNSFYLAFYGRPADPSGLKFWSQQLANNDGDLGAITQAFATSEEAQIRFGTDSVGNRIAEIYQQLFNRAPDATGLEYWTDVVAKGHASMADVAVAILKGAQGSDSTLSQLRQQAADAFTAAVEAGGTEYSGYASIEAARILVRAVTPDATAADLDLLVKAAVSFADTATKTPQVVEAIAVNTTLLALFDTARGVKEPVALAKALADTAKAAAGDPVTLESLLRGGGMDKVLKVMPAKATLEDVVVALAKGGLPAAVEVVYPTGPTAPTLPPKPVPSFGLDLSFKTVTQDNLDEVDDNVTNVKKVNVTFENKGLALNANQHFEYTLDGETWIDTNIDTTSTPNTIILQGVQLVRETSHITSAADADPVMTVFADYQDTITKIGLRAVDKSGLKSEPFFQEIVYDGHAETPYVTLKEDTSGENFGSNDDGVTKNPLLVVEGKEQGATLQYQSVPKLQKNVDTSVNGSTQDADELPWSDMLAIRQGENTVRVRQIDAAGNISGYDEIRFTFDNAAPSKPVIALVKDTGARDDDGVTTSGVVKITNLEPTVNTAWEYSIDGGTKWQFGHANDDSGEALLDLSANNAQDGIRNVLVRQVDKAGNVGGQSELLVVELDTTAPLQDFGFVSVTGASMNGSKVTTAQTADVVFGYTGALEKGSYVQWRADGGEWTKLDAANIDDKSELITIMNLDLTKSDPKIEVRVVDAAGNEGGIATVTIDGPFVKNQLTVTPSANGVTVDSPFMGMLYLTSGTIDQQINGNFLHGLVRAGLNEIGAQQSVVSGVFKVNGAESAVDLTGTVYTLGTNGTNEEMEGDVIFGFDGNDELTGNRGNNYLDGGAGADRITGNGGGDRIFANNGDILNYYLTSDSSLSSGVYKAAGALTREQMYKIQSYDTVTIEDESIVTFKFDDLEHSVSSAANPGITLAAGLETEALFQALTKGYNQATFSMYGAVLFDVTDNTQLLVVNNGDQIIDANDLIIEIIGSGSIGYFGGNIVYNSMTIEP